jgi:hypothetical protein
MLLQDEPSSRWVAGGNRFIIIFCISSGKRSISNLSSLGGTAAARAACVFSFNFKLIVSTFFVFNIEVLSKVVSFPEVCHGR